MIAVVVVGDTEAKEEEVGAGDFFELVLLLQLPLLLGQSDFLGYLMAELFLTVDSRPIAIEYLEQERILLKPLFELDIIFKLLNCGIAAEILKAEPKTVQNLNVLLVFLNKYFDLLEG